MRPARISKAIPVRLAIAAVCALVLVHALKHHTAASAPAKAANQVTVHSVRPTQADPNVTGPDDSSLAMVAPRFRENGLLVVFLPGTGGKPGCCQLFLQTAVSLGFHAIGLTYNNQTAVGARCGNDLNCYGIVRKNVFDGSERGVHSDLPPRDGVEHRLSSLLRYLTVRYPHEGWGGFLAHDAPLWSQIVMSGHSQGGSEAAYIATIRRLRGVITLSSPPDTNGRHTPADWVNEVPHGRTSIDSIVAFVHSGDPFFPRIAADWSAMDLGSLGPLTSVDRNSPPYGHAHQLISSAALPPVVLATHDSTVVDSATPICPNGTPEYAPVWDYMLSVAGHLRPHSTKPPC